MSTMALPVDPVDVNWRILQGELKPFTVRGRSRLAGHRRTCYGHLALEKQNGQPKREGRRMAVIARKTIGDLRDGVLEYWEDDREEDEQAHSDDAIQRWQAEQIAADVIDHERVRRLEAGQELGRRSRRRIRRVIAVEMDRHAKARATLRHHTVEELTYRVTHLEQLVAHARTVEEWDGYVQALVRAQLALYDLEVHTQYLAAA